MESTKRDYRLSDMVEQDLVTAPSLDLPTLAMEKFYMPRDNGKYMLFLMNVKKSIRPERCPYCQEERSVVFAGRTAPRLIHDVVRNNYRVDFIFQPVRLQCQKCGQRYVPRIEGIDERHSMTTRLLDFIKTECFLQPHTALAERSGVSIETIRNIMREEVVKYDMARDEDPPLAPRVLGIDEKHIIYAMRGTLVDIENGDLLDMLEGNDRDSMMDAIMRLKDWDTMIEVVTTDMNNSYLSWLPGFLPKAIIVIDKFHVMQDLSKRISTTRKSLYEWRKALVNKIEDNSERARQLSILRQLNKDKYLFNYSTERIARDTKTDKPMILATIVEEFPEFRLLKKLSYAVEAMYKKETYEEAVEAWDAWMELLPPVGAKQYKEWCDLYSVEPPMFDAFRSFKRSGFQFFKPYILNYFRPGCRVTNAATEGINRLIGAINAAGNGYSFEILRAKCLYASLVTDRITYSIDIDSVESWTPTTSIMISGSYRSAHKRPTYKTIYSFSSSCSPIRIKPMNIFSDNTILLDIIAVSGDTEKEQELIVDTEVLANDAMTVLGHIYCDGEDADTF